MSFTGRLWTSYSIKRIEQFYADIWTRAADLRTAGDSIVDVDTPDALRDHPFLATS